MANKNDFSGVIGGKGYDLFMEAFPHFTELQETVSTVLDRNLPKRSSYSILEVGCGPGPTTDSLLRVNPLINVTAVEVEPQMVVEARRNLSHYGDRVEIIQADIFDYLRDIDPNFYDGFASGWTIHNFKQGRRPELLRQIYRVLRPNGVFVNGDKYKQTDEDQHQKDYDWSITALRGVCERRNEEDWFNEWNDHMEYDERSEIVMDESGSLELMAKIGFIDPQVVWRKHMEAIVFAKK